MLIATGKREFNVWPLDSDSKEKIYSKNTWSVQLEINMKQWLEYQK